MKFANALLLVALFVMASSSATFAMPPGTGEPADKPCPIPGRDGRDGKDGRDGRDGKDGRDGRDGARGPRGLRGPMPSAAAIEAAVRKAEETGRPDYSLSDIALKAQSNGIFRGRPGEPPLTSGDRRLGGRPTLDRTLAFVERGIDVADRHTDSKIRKAKEAQKAVDDAQDSRISALEAVWNRVVGWWDILKWILLALLILAVLAALLHRRNNGGGGGNWGQFWWTQRGTFVGNAAAGVADAPRGPFWRA